MKQSCRGCIYSLRYGGDWGCNYLEIMHHARQLICKVRGKDDVCTVRVDGKPITPQVVDNERVPAHKYDMKPRDLEKVRNHQRRGGKPLSFDANKAIALINLGKTEKGSPGTVSGIGHGSGTEGMNPVNENDELVRWLRRVPSCGLSVRH